MADENDSMPSSYQSNALATPAYRRPGRTRNNLAFLALKSAWESFGHGSQG